MKPIVTVTLNPSLDRDGEADRVRPTTDPRRNALLSQQRQHECRPGDRRARRE